MNRRRPQLKVQELNREKTGNPMAMSAFRSRVPPSQTTPVAPASLTEIPRFSPRPPDTGSLPTSSRYTQPGVISFNI